MKTYNEIAVTKALERVVEAYSMHICPASCGGAACSDCRDLASCQDERAAIEAAKDALSQGRHSYWRRPHRYQKPVPVLRAVVQGVYKQTNGLDGSEFWSISLKFADKLVGSVNTNDGDYADLLLHDVIDAWEEGMVETMLVSGAKLVMATEVDKRGQTQRITTRRGYQVVQVRRAQYGIDVRYQRGGRDKAEWDEAPDPGLTHPV